MTIGIGLKCCIPLSSGFPTDATRQFILLFPAI